MFGSKLILIDLLKEKKDKSKKEDETDYDVGDKREATNKKENEKKKTERKDDSNDYDDSDVFSSKKPEDKKIDTRTSEDNKPDSDYDESDDKNETDKKPDKAKESSKRPEVVTPKPKNVYGHSNPTYFSGFGGYSGYSSQAAAGRRSSARDSLNVSKIKTSNPNVVSLSLSSIMNRLKEAQKSSFSVEKVQLDFTKPPTYNVRVDAGSTTPSSLVKENDNGVKTAIGGESMKKLLRKMHEALDEITKDHLVGQSGDKSLTDLNDTEQKAEDAVAGEVDSDVVQQEKVHDVGESVISTRKSSLNGRNLSSDLWTSKIVDMLVR